MDRIFTQVAERVARAAGKPLAFVGAAGLVVAWAISGPFLGFGEAWQLAINTTTTIVTFLMVFLVQSTQNRDSLALQTKLNSLIHAIDAADNRLVGLEHETDTRIEEERTRVEQEGT